MHGEVILTPRVATIVLWRNVDDQLHRFMIGRKADHPRPVYSSFGGVPELKSKISCMLSRHFNPELYPESRLTYLPFLLTLLLRIELRVFSW